jgi:transcription-repair coupling factor (superfamily II helicase)
VGLFHKRLHEPLVQHLQKSKRLTVSGSGNTSSKAYFIADILDKSDFKNFIWVTEDKDAAERALRNAQFWSKVTHPCPVTLFVESEEEIPDAECARRICQLLQPEKKIIITDIAAYFEAMPSKKEFEQRKLILSKTGKVNMMDLINDLLERGYNFTEDAFLKPGQYFKQGSIINIFPPNYTAPLKIEIQDSHVDEIFLFDQKEKKILCKLDEVVIFPLSFLQRSDRFSAYLDESCLVIHDELDLSTEYELLHKKYKESNGFGTVDFTAFPEDEDENHYNLFYLSLLKYADVLDFIVDVREKERTKWQITVSTRNAEELKNILDEEKISYNVIKPSDTPKNKSTDEFKINIVDVAEESYSPHSFQNAHIKILFVTDRELFDVKEKKRKLSVEHKVYMDFLTKLKVRDFVVHVDHGIGRFLGIDQKEIDNIKREYLKIAYAENDKLFVPIDQAEKVNKYIGVGNTEPRLSRLGSQDWATVKKRVQKETEKIAHELLQLYALRESAKGFKSFPDTKLQEEFEKKFPYEETPGQIRAIMDVKRDMESDRPMDRLICGDVGFGKTEVALRAAFKAVQSGKQVALLSPITILADQHYRTIEKRMEGFNVRIEMLSRFRSPAEQKIIIKKLAEGKIDIIVGTHRLFQSDIVFKDLGLLIIDEEQRFGVKQKEKLKSLRSEIDILTMSATPIPRTLNMSLNKIRDITTITTPPPGRLPIVTQVRRFSEVLIKEAIDREIERGGQVYFLHNRVQTIESMAEKLRIIFPKLRIVVAHGKLPPAELEQRIIAFKNKEFDILVSSTIIENGIDLANANTMIVNNTENFGLAQLYQLRGRIGRGSAQAYAYFLYHSQKLLPDAKKRLRAIVEASELGAGFQIAMHDLEIRGAGDILGANQHGAINVVGVNHFVRMLNQAVQEMKAGKKADHIEEVASITVDLPITGYIPDFYIEDSRDKINIYQKLSSADTFEVLTDLKDEIENEFGTIPEEVNSLFKVLELKILARRAEITNLRAMTQYDGTRQIVLTMGKDMQPLQIVSLLDHNEKWLVSGTTLKILMNDLGIQWIDALSDSLRILGDGKITAEPKKA